MRTNKPIQFRRLMLSVVALFFVGQYDTIVAQLADPQIFRGRGLQVATNQSILSSSASLKTDPELESILEKAERFRAEQQYGIASKLWQSVLERSGDALFSTDDRIYYSLSQQVEQILAELPADGGLETYRITADAGAKELMAEADGPFDERALQQIVRRYFISSLGDDAAFTLSSIYMDQYDFVGAIRMLRKIADRYPDPSVSMVNVYTRMAVCQSMMGERDVAMVALEKANELAAESGSLVSNYVSDVVSTGSESNTGRRVKEGFKIPLANRNRSGLMPSPPAGLLSRKLEAQWQYYFDPGAKRWADIKRVKPIFGADTFLNAAETVTSKEDQMIDKWRKQNWRPSGDLLFDGDRVYFKTLVDLTVWNRDANSGKVVWRPLWRNEYKTDDYTAMNLLTRRRFNRRRNTVPTGPNEVHEIQLFADRVSSQMSVQNGVLYTIEGKRFDSAPERRRGNVVNQAYYNPRRSRTNQLTAYNATTGRLLWTLPAIDTEDRDNPEIEQGVDSPWLQSGGFMSAPVQYGELVIAAVNHGGAISVYGLDPADNGKTVWKSFLCDESEMGANPHSPVNLSIDGSDLFATCGLGVVFILDPTTGLVRMAKRYDREAAVKVVSQSFRRTVPQITFDSWSTDTIVAFGRQMICFSSDAKHIEGIDRNTGEMIWRGDVKPLEAKVDYLLGVYKGMLYAAGPETILAFDLRQEGRMVWGGNQMFDGKLSYGRGMLTPDGIYMPVEDSIYKFSLSGDNGKPKLTGRTSVELGTGAPVGNLYSDGKKIWVLGANRVYALGPVTKPKTKEAS